MKLTKKIMALFAVVAFSSSAFAKTDWASFDIDAYNKQAQVLSDGLGDFVEQLAFAVPQAATQQNVWADAYIGKVFPSVPPHFGGGLNFGLTHIDTSGLAKAAKSLNIDNIEDSYYFPVFTVDLRIGGLLLPFDFDIAFMKTGTIGTELMGADLDVDFFAFGIDARYAIIEGGLIMPKLSVGAGYFYNEGTFNAGSKYAEAQVDYKVQTMYLSAQVSKSILICTPFVGLRAMVSSADNSWSWKMKDQGALTNLSSLAGAKTSDSGSYKSDGMDFGEMQPQIFAGVGFNFLVVQTTLSVTADLRNIADKGLWSGALSLRLKL